MEAAEYEDEGGFEGYVVSTVDLGPGLFAGALLAFLFAYGLLLPCLVSWGNHRDRHKFPHDKTEIFQEDSLDTQQQHQGKSPTQVIVDTSRIHEDNDVRHRKNNNHRQQQQQQQDDEDDLSVGSKSSSKTSSSHSTFSSAVAAILDHPRAAKSKSQRKRRRARDRQIVEAHNRSIASDKSAAAAFNFLSGVHPGALPPSSSSASPTNNNNNPGVQVFAPASSPANNGEGGESEKQGTTPEASSGLSPSANNAAVSTPAAAVVPPPKYAQEFMSLGVLDKIALISAFDIETKRIIRLATPFCTQALITGLMDILTVAVVGKLIGTREVSAFVIVSTWVELSSEFVGGLHEALATLGSQAIGARNKVLAGSYVQIVAILYTLFFIPFAILWVCYLDAILRWYGLDEETVKIGMQYTYILVVDCIVDGVGEAVHGLLDVAGHEKFSTLIGATEEVTAFLIILVWALVGNPSLNTVGLVQLFMGILFLGLNIGIIYWRGWFKPYYEGMFGSFALYNGKAVWLVCKTASSLSLGMLLTDGEWEIFTILAQVLGPAEVVAWGIIGSIWTGAHELIDAIADASEIRCAFLLGSGDPNRARVSACKSTMIGAFAALYLTSLIYMAGDDLPTWFTNDPALQQIMQGIIPMFGLANFVMALDTISWTLLGSQGRYRLATIMVCLASWLVTIPLAVLFSVVWNVDLNGQMTAFTIGYIVLGVTHAYFLLRSDWFALSEQVMNEHEAENLADTEPVSTDKQSSTSNNSRQHRSQSSSSSTSSQQRSQPSASSLMRGSMPMPMEISSLRQDIV